MLLDTTPHPWNLDHGVEALLNIVEHIPSPELKQEAITSVDMMKAIQYVSEPH